MRKRICPICDHVMKYSHYCSFCRQWIKEPNYINATYHLNERHPANETDCEYHTQVRQPWNPEKKQIGIPMARSMQEINRAGTQTHKNSVFGQMFKIIFSFIAVWMLVSVVFPLLFFLL